MKNIILPYLRRIVLGHGRNSLSDNPNCLRPAEFLVHFYWRILLRKTVFLAALFCTTMWLWWWWLYPAPTIEDLDFVSTTRIIANIDETDQFLWIRFLSFKSTSDLIVCTSSRHWFCISNIFQSEIASSDSTRLGADKILFFIKRDLCVYLPASYTEWTTMNDKSSESGRLIHGGIQLLFQNSSGRSSMTSSEVDTDISSNNNGIFR